MNKFVFYKNMIYSKLDFVMKNRFVGMKMGSRTRLDRPRLRQTQKTDRKTKNNGKIVLTLIRDGRAYW